MMTREGFLRGEIQFLAELLDKIAVKYPDTKKYIKKEIDKRTKRNKKIEDELDKNPDPFMQLAKRIKEGLEEE